MLSNAKYFAARLNHCLDATDAPASARKRSTILSKILDIPIQQAWAFIEGQQTPDQELLQRIANEFEVDSQWLAGA